MNETTNFFTDYQGVQQLRDLPIDNLSVAECEYERLKYFFKYAHNVETAEGLIYLNYLHSEVKKQIAFRIGDEIPIDSVICNILTRIVKLYSKRSEIVQQVFVRLSQNHLKKIEKALENLIEKLPKNYYEHVSKPVIRKIEYDPQEGFKSLDPVFYIPLKEQFPELDKTLEQSRRENFSFLYVKPREQNSKSSSGGDPAYPLETMFECYKDLIPSYNYQDFKAIIHTELNSGR
nr:uncharacterized protein LOC111511815 [Leptinotarsa decemlineata]